MTSFGSEHLWPIRGHAGGRRTPQGRIMLQGMIGVQSSNEDQHRSAAQVDAQAA
jgi:hypothetical protein